MKKLNIMAVMACIAVPLILGSCGSKKKLADNTPASTPATTTQPTTPGGAPENTTNLALVRKVIENATDARNIVSSIDFNIKSGVPSTSTSSRERRISPWTGKYACAAMR